MKAINTSKKYKIIPSETIKNLNKSYQTKKAKKHPLKSAFFWAPLAILIIAGGIFAYTQFSGNSEGITGGVIGVKDLSSKLTGFLIDEDNDLPIAEKFDVKISGAVIDLSSEEQALQTDLNSKCYRRSKEFMSM